MNLKQSGPRLIEEMLSDPVDFDDRGGPYILLQHFFNDLPIESLRPLLSHENDRIRRAAMFIASELGHKARVLIDTITPLVQDPDPHTSWYAMESVLLCATDEFAGFFVAVVRMLECNAEALKRLAMRLISNASLSQLEKAKRRFQELGSSALVHRNALQTLIDGDKCESNIIRQMLDNDNQLGRLYGAIAANRLRPVHPDLLEYAAMNTNPDVRKFAIEALERE